MNKHESKNKHECVCMKCSKQVRAYASAFFKLCAICNGKRLNELKAIRRTQDKSKHEVQYGGRSHSRTQLMKRQREPTGEREMFLKIWAVRAHICTNCWDGLGSEPLAQYFAHIKHKSTHAHLRLVESNIMLLCFECHRLYDQGTKEQYNKRTYKH